MEELRLESKTEDCGYSGSRTQIPQKIMCCAKE